MSWTGLVVLTLLSWTATPDVAALIARLSSPAEAERDEAAGALEELGRPALPPLRQARVTAAPELRGRITTLIDLIERQRLLSSTRVQLNFEDRPLADVVETLRRETGFPLTLGAETLGIRRVTLREMEPVAFWSVLDRLESSLPVRHRPEYRFSRFGGELNIRLDQSDGPRVPTSDAGPFRVYLVRLSRHDEVRPTRVPSRPKTRESLTAELHVFGEPGLALNQVGAVVLGKVTDDRGRDLRPEPPLGPPPRRRSPPRFEDGYASLF